MNPAIPQTTPGRRADLNPFNDSVAADVPQASTAYRASARKVERVVHAEYGCVDWYQYQADEDQVTH